MASPARRLIRFLVAKTSFSVFLLSLQHGMNFNIATANAGDELGNALAKGIESAARQAAVPGSRMSSLPNIAYGETIVKTASPAVTGTRIVLEVDSEMIVGSRFQWFQVEGPKAVIDDPRKASLTVTVPPGAEQITFVLIAARAEEVRVMKVVVPVRGGKISSVTGEATGQKVYPGAPIAKSVRADAGDDQVGLVGHRVTLNGARSVPSDGKTARWMQVNGPVALNPKQQGVYFSFIPAGPGTYRFALVVSGEGEISEPDEVTVLVGTPPAGSLTNAPTALSLSATDSLALNPATAPLPAPTATPIPPPVPPAESLVTANVGRIPDGARVAAEVADVMEAVAQRSNLYTSFASLQNEMARRLDVVIPTEPAKREVWTQNVLLPLSVYTGTELGAVGLDIRPSQVNPPPMSPAQQERVREHFTKLARAFRTVSTSTTR